MLLEFDTCTFLDTFNKNVISIVQIVIILIFHLIELLIKYVDLVFRFVLAPVWCEEKLDAIISILSRQ